MRRLIFAACTAALGACSSGTSIHVSDPDARIFVNGEYVGTGHGYYSDRKPAFTKQDVTIRKAGCAEQSYVMRRNERPDLGAIISAYYLALPVLWLTQYKNQHAYEFDCEPKAAD
ncbi:MAG TPA: hypothetical protein VE907_07955 [Gammaproteobacteria bacterium]|nr:hypothetical protein [Gammaproteobacteria bacterium]